MCVCVSVCENVCVSPEVKIGQKWLKKVNYLKLFSKAQSFKHKVVLPFALPTAHKHFSIITKVTFHISAQTKNLKLSARDFHSRVCYITL